MAVEKHILTKKEKALLMAILSLSEKNDDAICLVTPLELFKMLPYDLDYSANELEPLMKGLEIDDYFEYILTDKKGEPVYCVTMHQKGLSYARMERAWRRSIWNKVMITAAMAVVSGTVVWIVRVILNSIINKGG